MMSIFPRLGSLFIDRIKTNSISHPTVLASASRGAIMTADSDMSIGRETDLKVNAKASAHNVECANGFLEDHGMSPEEEKKMVRKMDLHIFPIVIALYILSFLDRVNIGM